MKIQITATRKSPQGDILGLCNGQQYWPKAQAISNIESGERQYYVLWADLMRTDIHVVNSPYGKYLRTDRDNTPKNNLDDLPNC